jgi:hypothetical protein
MPANESLSRETLDFIVRRGLEQIELIDRMEAALVAGDVPKVLELARVIVHLEHEGETKQ